jgi:hypothetical protein
MASLLSVSFCWVTKIISEIRRLAFFFSSFVEKDLPVRESSTEGIESGEILAQRPHVWLGGPKGKISELS